MRIVMQLHRILKLSVILLFGSTLSASDWTNWRGPNQNGVADGQKIVTSWELDGENMLWKADFVGRSTPVVMDGRVYALGRGGTDVDRSAVLACFDAASGNKLWQNAIPLYHTTVPFNRVGWANIAGDPETGHVYMLSVGGLLLAFDRDGNEIWQRSLTEEFWMWSGYGGRTHSPLIDGDRLILTFANYGWGDDAVWRHRSYSFDKYTGEVNWVVTPGGQPKDLNTQSTPVFTVVNGRRLMVSGNADGSIYAIDANTGESVWQFRLSKRGINASVIADGDRIYATHSEENIDTGTQGRFVCIDATGSGDITSTHELWRNDEGAGFSSPTLHEGRIYYVDNSANIHCISKEDGKSFWSLSLGTVGKASPVFADGKILVPELNGKFYILQPKADTCLVLDVEEIRVPDGRLAEIYGAPAVAYNRIYFTSEQGIYCVGDASLPMPAMNGKRKSGKAAKIENIDKKDRERIASLQVRPTHILRKPGDKVKFQALAFDAKGKLLGKLKKADFSLEGVDGKINNKGELSISKKATQHIGRVRVMHNEISAQNAVRIVPELPWSFDFSDGEPKSSPESWVGAKNKYVYGEFEGEKVLVKPPSRRGLHRSSTYFGPSDMMDYTIQADFYGSRKRRRIPDVGLIANGYILDLMGKHQRLQIRAWTSVLRMAKQEDFAWDAEKWYTIKMQVEYEGERALIRGKVWPRDEQEPEAWSIVAEDPHPVRHGSPGIYGYSPVNVYYDNIKVYRSPR